MTQPAQPAVDRERVDPGTPFRPPRAGAGLPFLPMAPLVVAFVGLAVAFGIGLVGLDHLSRQGDAHAAARADLLAATVAARLSQLPPDKQLEATQLAARRSATQVLVVTPPHDSEPPRLVHDASLGPPDAATVTKMLAQGRGVVVNKIGRARFSVKAIGPPSGPVDADAPRLIVLVPEPTAAAGAPALVTSLVALVTLLLGVAVIVAYAVSRDVMREVDFVTQRVHGMAVVRTEPTGELIAARTLDEVGLLTVAFNKLVGRFGKAEKAYRLDLERASAQDRERAAFLAAVSHELRSPLNAILGFADILMEEVDGPLEPTAREEVEQIRGSGTHLITLINDILELSALESGQLRLSRSRVDITSIANEVVREAKGLALGKPITVRVEETGPVVARVDGRRIRQVIGNLVNNAVKFTQHGEVVVRVERAGGLAQISVQDTGPGISPQERALIFQEYKQTRTEKEKGKRRGTGLGLAIARRLVMLHHGSISVESELGRGSIFKVIVPIGNVDAPSIQVPALPPAGPSPTGGITGPVKGGPA